MKIVCSFNYIEKREVNGQKLLDRYQAEIYHNAVRDGVESDHKNNVKPGLKKKISLL